MHLVIPTHLSLFWVVCHPSRIFPPKEFEREPQNRLSLLLTPRPHSLLPLVYGLPLLYWLGTSWWCLRFMRAPLPYLSMAYLLLMHLPWLKGLSVHSATRSWLLVAWMGFWAFVLYVLLPSWAGPCLIVSFSFFNPFFASFAGLLAFLPCYFVIPTTLLFDPCLLGLF